MPFPNLITVLVPQPISRASSPRYNSDAIYSLTETSAPHSSQPITHYRDLPTTPTSLHRGTDSIISITAIPNIHGINIPRRSTPITRQAESKRHSPRCCLPTRASSKADLRGDGSLQDAARGVPRAGCKCHSRWASKGLIDTKSAVARSCMLTLPLFWWRRGTRGLM